jgi:nicotinate-nucleotide adenylyltransferase
MLRALADDTAPYHISVNQIERKLGEETDKPVYTYHVLRHLSEEYGSFARFRLVIGSDILAETDKWYRWEAIKREFNPIIVGRKGHGGGDCDYVIPDFSSTEIRRRIREGDPWMDLVTPSVAKMLPGPYLEG